MTDIKAITGATQIVIAPPKALDTYGSFSGSLVYL
jgi:hypothetical protein